MSTSVLFARMNSAVLLLVVAVLALAISRGYEIPALVGWIGVVWFILSVCLYLAVTLGPWFDEDGNSKSKNAGK